MFENKIKNILFFIGILFFSTSFSYGKISLNKIKTPGKCIIEYTVEDIRDTNKSKTLSFSSKTFDGYKEKYGWNRNQGFCFLKLNQKGKYHILSNRWSLYKCFKTRIDGVKYILDYSFEHKGKYLLCINTIDLKNIKLKFNKDLFFGTGTFKIRSNPILYYFSRTPIKNEKFNISVEGGGRSKTFPVIMNDNFEYNFNIPKNIEGNIIFDIFYDKMNIGMIALTNELKEDKKNLIQSYGNDEFIEGTKKKKKEVSKIKTKSKFNFKTILIILIFGGLGGGFFLYKFQNQKFNKYVNKGKDYLDEGKKIIKKLSYKK